MFAAIVILTSPIWLFALFIAFVWLSGGGKSPRQQAIEAQQRKDRNEEIKAAGQRAVKQTYRKEG